MEEGFPWFLCERNGIATPACNCKSSVLPWWVFRWSRFVRDLVPASSLGSAPRMMWKLLTTRTVLIWPSACFCWPVWRPHSLPWIRWIYEYRISLGNTFFIGIAEYDVCMISGLLFSVKSTVISHMASIFRWKRPSTHNISCTLEIGSVCSRL